MFIPILKKSVQGRKHPGICAFAEQALLSYTKFKNVVKKYIIAYIHIMILRMLNYTIEMRILNIQSK